MSLVRSDDPKKILLRERVVQLRCSGYSYPAIAGQLGISVGTVWNYANVPMD